MQTKVLSCAKVDFKREDGSVRTFYRVYVADDSGNVGSVNSNQFFKSGDLVNLGFRVYDGKLQVRVI